jgi:hypothetical protein
MATQLHILTRPDDSLAAELVARQREAPGAEVVLVDLTQRDPDYHALLEKIFAADSVAVW